MFTAHALYGWVLFERGNFDEAEKHLIQGFDGMTTSADRVPLSQPELLAGTAGRLVQIYDRWGLPELVEWWSERWK